MFDFKYKILFHLSFLIFSASISWAGPQFFTYEGYIEDKSVPPVPVTTSQSFLLQIKSPTNCVLYQETQTITPNAGNFSLQVGTGSVSAGYSNADIPAFFSNEITISSAGGGCSYTPAPTDSRSLVVSIFDTGAYAVIANISLSAAPFAFNTERVGGRKSSAFLKIVDGSQTGLDLTSAQVTELYNLITGASTRYVQPSSATSFSNTVSFSTAPQYSGTPSAGSDLTNKVYVDNAVSTAVAGALPNVGTAGTYFKVMTDSKGRVTGGSSSLLATDIPSLDASAISTGTLSGGISVNTAGNIYSSGVVTGATVSATTLKIYKGANYLQFTAPTLSGNVNWILPNVDGTSGQVLKTDGSGNLSWITPAVGSGTVSLVSTGIGMSGGPITTTGTISLANTSVSAGSYGTLVSIPNFIVDAQGRITGATNNAIPTANTTTTGLISSTDWNNFAGKLNKAGDTMTGLLTLSADPAVNLGSATKQYVDAVTNASVAAYVRKDGTVAFTGPQSMGSNKLTFVTDPTSAQDAATKNYVDTKFITKNLPAAPSAGQDGQVLRWNNTALSWEYFTVAAGGVSAISGTTPITVSGSPTNPNISLANTAVTGGSYGASTSIPAFNVDAQGRLTGATNTPIPTATSSLTGLLTSTDWINFNNAYTAAVTNASSSNTANSLVKRDISGNFVAGTITATLFGNASTATNFTGSLSGEVSGLQSATTVNSTGSTGFFKNSGNAFGGPANLGTASGDSTNSLNLITNGVSRLSVTPVGNVGINTSAPSSALEVNGTLTAGSIVASSIAAPSASQLSLSTVNNNINVNSGTGIINLSGNVKIGTSIFGTGVTYVQNMAFCTASISSLSVLANASTNTPISCPGASINSVVSCSITGGNTTFPQLIVWTSKVTTAGAIQVTFVNTSNLNLTPSTFLMKCLVAD